MLCTPTIETDDMPSAKALEQLWPNALPDTTKLH